MWSHQIWHRLRKSPSALLGLVMLLTLITTALLAPWLAPHDPYRVHTRQSLQPPRWNHPFGTDWLGRDVLSRVIYGARVSLQVGLLVEAFAVVIGVSLGTLAGFYGGKVDTLLMRITDTFMAFPSLVLAIALMAVFQQPGLFNVIVVLSILQWTPIARVVRGEVLSLKERDFVQAVRATGASDLRVLVRHVLPNCFAPVIVTATIGIAGNILSEAGLSFLGFGTQPPTVSWGTMLAQGRNYLTVKPWVCVFPGLALMLTVLGFNLLGDGLRDLLDPRLRT
ncbi:MAG: ABC transporter permease [Nitrospinota bacterium]|nr:MAG: ABC transporter permease [Nitrospinota bacterium]